MSPEARIRISLSAGELEIQGPPEFLSKYEDTIGPMLERLRTADVQAAPKALPTGGAPATPKATGEFGEVLHALPNTATDTDRILLAGSFTQASSTDGTFATGQANQLLIEQGIKVSNPSQCMTNNLKAKRVFKVGSKYKVSKQGEAHLTKLTG